MACLKEKIDEVLSGNLKSMNPKEYRQAFETGLLNEDTYIEKYSKQEKKYERWKLSQCLTWYLMHAELSIYLEVLHPRMTGIPEDGELMKTLKQRQKTIKRIKSINGKKIMKDLKATERVLEAYTPMRRVRMMLNTDTIHAQDVLSILQDEVEKDRVEEFLNDMADALLKSILSTKDADKSINDYQRFSSLSKLIDRKLDKCEKEISFSNILVNMIVDFQGNVQDPINQLARFMGCLYGDCEMDPQQYIEWLSRYRMVEKIEAKKLVKAIGLFIVSMPRNLPYKKVEPIKHCIDDFKEALKEARFFSVSCYVERVVKEKRLNWL